MHTIPSPRPRAVVVGVDGSPSSVTALQLAARLIPLAGDVIHAVTSWQYPPPFGAYGPVDVNHEELAGKVLDQALNEAFPGGTPLGLKRGLIQGSPAEVLLEESTHASMVVVGSRGHGGFAGLLLGSVSTAVTERAKCPVLVSHGALQPLEGQGSTLPLVGASA
ncbi:universal stress protein [Arthrobacter antioxidans]|uniref:universal stress protein n=1 Tax=Arthrobacter antioxidans TaxID=2895818 RepID=UPI001FFE696D|nr:universal stress protein [Arthrobacter antioxidans]